MTQITNMQQRQELASLLEMAARAEHALLCRYLFAAFSFKRTHDEGGVSYAQLEQMRRWEANILKVSRQEMEHLGLVLNLRTAIGEAPSFDMPAFPFQEQYEDIVLEFSLDKFGETAMTSFVMVEMPRKLPEKSPAYRYLKKRIKDFDPDKVDVLARMYQKIRELVEALPEETLFIGPPAAQFDTNDIFPGSIRGLDISKSPAYNVQLEKIDDRKSALAAIDQITAEGEGAHEEGGAGSHFAIFMQILTDLDALRAKDPGFEPARPVASNPSLNCAKEGNDSTQLAYEFSRDALALFESSYQTMLLGLTRFFTFPENDQEEMAALQQAVFFPMMTTVIRPLGEVLTMLPSAETGCVSTRAGASFNRPVPIELSPHKWAAFNMLYMRYGDMQDMASELLDKVDTLPKDVPRALIKERLTYLYQQIYRSRMNLKVNYEKKPDEI